STCKISGCLSYRILDSGPDGTQTTLTEEVLDILPERQKGAFTKEDGEKVIGETGKRVK
ncbi:hypothetical protein QP556_23780, partial [Citrobacter freundii]|nr:hypothetical protein [Citrobacter freundii]